MMSVKRALGLISNAEGAGTGNTALVFHAKRLLALHEADMPYALRVLCEGVVQTLERVTLGSQTKFTAHPKVCQLLPSSHGTQRLDADIGIQEMLTLSSPSADRPCHWQASLLQLLGRGCPVPDLLCC